MAASARGECILSQSLLALDIRQRRRPFSLVLGVRDFCGNRKRLGGRSHGGGGLWRLAWRGRRPERRCVGLRWRLWRYSIRRRPRGRFAGRHRQPGADGRHGAYNSALREKRKAAGRGSRDQTNAKRDKSEDGAPLARKLVDGSTSAPRLGLVIERQDIIPPSRFMLFALSREVLLRAAEGVLLAQRMPSHQGRDASLPFTWHVQKDSGKYLRRRPSSILARGVGSGPGAGEGGTSCGEPSDVPRPLPWSASQPSHRGDSPRDSSVGAVAYGKVWKVLVRRLAATRERTRRTTGCRSWSGCSSRHFWPRVSTTSCRCCRFPSSRSPSGCAG